MGKEPAGPVIIMSCGTTVIFPLMTWKCLLTTCVIFTADVQGPFPTQLRRIMLTWSQIEHVNTTMNLLRRTVDPVQVIRLEASNLLNLRRRGSRKLLKRELTSPCILFRVELSLFHSYVLIFKSSSSIYSVFSGLLVGISRNLLTLFISKGLN